MAGRAGRLQVVGDVVRLHNTAGVECGCVQLRSGTRGSADVWSPWTPAGSAIAGSLGIAASTPLEY